MSTLIAKHFTIHTNIYEMKNIAQHVNGYDPE